MIIFQSTNNPIFHFRMHFIFSNIKFSIFKFSNDLFLFLLILIKLSQREAVECIVEIVWRKWGCNVRCTCKGFAQTSSGINHQRSWTTPKWLEKFNYEFAFICSGGICKYDGNFVVVVLQLNQKTEFLNRKNCSRRKRSSICWTRWKFTRTHMVLYSWWAHGIIHFSWLYYRWLVPLRLVIVLLSNQVRLRRLVRNSLLKWFPNIWIM